MSIHDMAFVVLGLRLCKVAVVLVHHAVVTSVNKKSDIGKYYEVHTGYQ